MFLSEFNTKLSELQEEEDVKKWKIVFIFDFIHFWNSYFHKN